MQSSRFFPPTFRTFDTFKTILTQVVILGTLAAGSTIVLISGRLFAREKKERVYEVVDTEQAMRAQDLKLDDIYVVRGPEKMFGEPILVRVFGVFTV